MAGVLPLGTRVRFTSVLAAPWRMIPVFLGTLPSMEVSLTIPSTMCRRKAVTFPGTVYSKGHQKLA